MRGAGEIVFVAGQVGWSRAGGVVSDDFVLQFAQALENVLDVVFAAGGRADSIARMTVYVTDKLEYLRRAKEVGAAWRQRGVDDRDVVDADAGHVRIIAPGIFDHEDLECQRPFFS